MFSSIYYDRKKNEMHLWEYNEEGKKFHYLEPYTSYCYIYDKNGDYKDLYGKSCKRKEFKNWWDQSEYIKKYETLEGDIKPEDRFLVDKYIDIDEFKNPPELSVHYIDIETESGNGFPDPWGVKNEILLISIYSSYLKKVVVFGTRDYNSKSNKIEYIYCEDETELLKKYFKWHRENYPDVITGWNTLAFDIPYILNRAKYLIGERSIVKYSPIGKVETTNYQRHNGKNTCYSIAGINQLDYYDLYRNFSQGEKESYKLGYISTLELKKTKVEFDGTLDELWREDWTKFVNYNIQDAMLVKQLEDKLGYIKLCQAIGYMGRCSFERFASHIKVFDNYMMTILKKKKIILPTAKYSSTSDRTLIGGYVSEPQKGYYSKVVSYDFTSLYPHIIMGLNISPETLVGEILKDGEFIDFVDIEKINDNSEYSLRDKIYSGKELKDLIIKYKLSIAGNGCLFKSKKGIIPIIMKKIFAIRKRHKGLMLENERKFQETKDKKYSNLKATYDALQNAEKITLNSMYGALANQACRLYNPSMALAVTMTGQKLTKYTEKFCNKYFREKYGYESNITLYCDTDSIYLNFERMIPEDISEEDFIDYVNKFTKEEFRPFLEKQYDIFSKQYQNMQENTFDLKRECIAIGAIFVQKKKYVLKNIDSEGVRYSPPKMKITGLEIIRSSTPSFCRDKIKDIVQFIFDNPKAEIELAKKIRLIKKEFKKADISTISFPRNIKNMSKYIDEKGKHIKGVTVPIHVRASNNYNMLLKKLKLTTRYEKIHEADKVKFIYLNSSNPIKQNIIAFKDDFPAEFKLKEYIDLDLQFEKSFIAPIKKILEAMDWNINTETVNLIDTLF